MVNAMTDPTQMTDDELRAEIKALEDKVRAFERYHRRRWELVQELGSRSRRMAGDEAMLRRNQR
jgi:hypothetical protein